MDSQQLRGHVKEVVATLHFAWISMKPELLDTYRRLAMDSSPATRGIRTPLDMPMHDLVTGTMIRPSEMQRHVLDRVAPSFLAAIQSIAEDELNGRFGNHASIYSRIEQSVRVGLIDRQLASNAHYWRIVRNVLAHGGGVISQRTEQEVNDLHADGKILFDKFIFWGALLDAGHNDIPDAVLVPLIDSAVANPHDPAEECPEINVLSGNKIQIGLADLLAAGDVWASMIQNVCGR